LDHLFKDLDKIAVCSEGWNFFLLTSKESAFLKCIPLSVLNDFMYKISFNRKSWPLISKLLSFTSVREVFLQHHFWINMKVFW